MVYATSPYKIKHAEAGYDQYATILVSLTLSLILVLVLVAREVRR
jgi:hypothetical protein